MRADKYDKESISSLLLFGRSSKRGAKSSQELVEGGSLQLNDTWGSYIRNMKGGRNYTKSVLRKCKLPLPVSALD